MPIMPRIASDIARPPRLRHLRRATAGLLPCGAVPAGRPAPPPQLPHCCCAPCTQRAPASTQHRRSASAVARVTYPKRRMRIAHAGLSPRTHCSPQQPLCRELFRQPQPPRPPPRPTRPVPAQRPRPWSLATPEHARCHCRRRSPAARREAAVPSQLRTSAARCWAPCDVPRPFRLYFRQILARGHPTGATRPLRRQRRPNRPKSGGGTSCPPLTQ
jgi:hypothetical protein